MDARTLIWEMSVETSLYVEELDRLIQFYRRVFGFDLIYSDDHMCAMNVAGHQVLLLFKIGASAKLNPPHEGSGNTHLAFSISKSDLASWEDWLSKHSIRIENRINWEEGGTSLCFSDPDGHVVEVATPGVWSIY